MRQPILRWVAMLAILIASPVAAQETAPAPFTNSAFAKAQAQGRTILIESYAIWCLPCRVQEPIIADLRRKSPYSEIVVLRIGEDMPEQLWDRFGLVGYGSLVVFKGYREIARGNPVHRAEVTRLLRKGL